MQGVRGVGRGQPLNGGAEAGAGTMRQAPSLAGSLPLFFGDGSSAAVSDSPQATGEGTFSYEYPVEKCCPAGRMGRNR